MALVWYSLASAFNFTSEWRARQTVDSPGRQLLSEQELDHSTLLFDNMVYWVDERVLSTLGVSHRELTDLEIRYSPSLLAQDELPSLRALAVLRESRQSVSVERRYLQGEPMWLYQLGARSTMSAQANALLRGDFAWTRGPYGALSPIKLTSRLDERERLPDHNFIEDRRGARFTDGPTPLEHLAAERTETIWLSEQDFWLLPLDLLSTPRRLACSTPLLETYRFRAAVNRFNRRRF